MKQFRRFWRRNAGLLGVLCGAALLLAAVLYLNSGQPVRVEQAEPTPVPSQTPTPSPTPTPAPGPTPTQPLILYTTCPEEVYAAMRSDVLDWNGKALMQVDKVDYTIQPPGSDIRSWKEIKSFYYQWEEYLYSKEHFVVWNGWVIDLRKEPPEEMREKYGDWGADNFDFVYVWRRTIERGREWVEKRLRNIEEINFRKEPPIGGGLYEKLNDEKRKKYTWLAYYQYELLIWGDWIISLCNPPPGYDISKDPLKALGYDDETIVHFREGGDWMAGNGYGDVWEKFFEENPDVLYID